MSFQEKQLHVNWVRLSSTVAPFWSWSELHVSDATQIIKFIEFEKILTEQFCDYRYFRRKEIKSSLNKI